VVRRPDSEAVSHVGGIGGGRQLKRGAGAVQSALGPIKAFLSLKTKPAHAGLID
jgi:hypothetical protein